MGSETLPIGLCSLDVYAGERLDVALGRLLGRSRSFAQKLIRAGAVILESRGVCVRPSYRVSAGDRVRILWTGQEQEPGKILPEPLPLEILYEDPEVLALNKPAGLVVHPAAGHWTGTLVHGLLARYGNSLSQLGGPVRAGIVHRLDKLTSGVLLVAKTDEAHAALAEQFRARKIKKVYRALVHGIPKPPQGVYQESLGRHPVDRKKRAVIREGGRPARTEYRVIASGKKVSLVELFLHTGRTHQARVHLAYHGHPILGDPLYGKQGKDRALGCLPRRMYLHAHRIGFSHPRTGEFLELEAPLPEEFSYAF
jgi:23S rRNA pseudouridine1911/1915/1917 synthase